MKTKKIDDVAKKVRRKKRFARQDKEATPPKKKEKKKKKHLRGWHPKGDYYTISTLIIPLFMMSFTNFSASIMTFFVVQK